MGVPCGTYGGHKKHTQRILMQKHERKGLLEIPRHGWHDNIKIDIK
jgi:hypothetical protein